MISTNPNKRAHIELSAPDLLNKHNVSYTKFEVFYEHGTWWLRAEDVNAPIDECETTFRVVDAKGGDVNGLDIEEV